MRWEYKTIKCKKRYFFSGGVNTEAIDNSINAMAKDGWELVSMCPHFVWATPSGILLVFKRQK